MLGLEPEGFSRKFQAGQQILNGVASRQVRTKQKAESSSHSFCTAPLFISAFCFPNFCFSAEHGLDLVPQVADDGFAVADARANRDARQQ